MKYNWLKRLFKKLSNLLFPEKLKCIFCGADVPSFDKQPYCDHCKASLPFNSGHKCKTCDVEISDMAQVCDLCKTQHKSFDATCGVFKYRDIVRSLIIRFKDKNASYYAEPMAKLMHDALPKNMKNFDLIIPVPISTKSYKKRGYNQSELLAKELSLLSGKEYRCDILVKAKETPPQKELGFKERQKNLTSAFQLKKYREIKNKNILLIDDVVTTSATANICSHLLKRHCNKVYVLAFARNTISEKKEKENP